MTSPDEGLVSLNTEPATVSVKDRYLSSTFIPNTTGPYSITCQATDSSRVYLGQGDIADALIRTTVGIMASIAVGVLAAGLLIGGLAWLLVRRSSNRRIIQAQQMAGAGYPQPGYPQPYPQPGAPTSQGGQWPQP